MIPTPENTENAEGFPAFPVPLKRFLFFSVFPALFVVNAGCGSEPAPDERALDRYYAANALFDDGRWAEAVPHYEFTISARDRLKDAYHKLAYCHEKLGDGARAVEVLEKVLRVDRQDSYALRHLARMYAHRGRPAEAVAALKALLALDPGDTAVRDEIGRIEVLR